MSEGRGAGANLRDETDTMGSLQVPSTALYGIRTQRCVDNMSFSGRRMSGYPAFIRALAMVKKVAAITNARCGVFDDACKDAIIFACDAVLAGRHNDAFVVDVYAGGGSIALNTNMNEVLANLANEFLGRPPGTYAPIDPKTHVNASQSTADSCHTALHLAVIEKLEELAGQMTRLIAVSQHHAQSFQNIAVIARTCLQPAMKTSLGAFFSAAETMLNRRLKDLRQCSDDMLSVNLGGTVIGTGEGASASYRAAVLSVLSDVSGKKFVASSNLLDAAQNIDVLARVSSSLSLLAGALIKMAKDLRLMSSGASAGFGEITLPAVQEGSSFFKDKVNPVVPETLIQCCFLVIGADHTVRAALEHGELNLNVFEGAAGFAVLESLDFLSQGLAMFTDRCFAGIRANAVRSQSYEETLSKI